MAPSPSSISSFDGGASSRRIQSERQPAALEHYSREDIPMAHRNVYLACPWLWQAVGHAYRELDVVASFSLLLGSIGVAVISYLRLADAGEPSHRNAALLVHVSLFLVADVLLELRAIYARLWQRFHKRPSWSFYTGIALLALGALLFLITIALDMEDRSVDGKRIGYVVFVATLTFIAGTSFLTRDAYKQLEEPLSLALREPYLIGSILMVIGSAVFLVPGICNTCIGAMHDSSPSNAIIYRSDSVCSERLVDHCYGLGGVFFSLGGLCFVVFSLKETRSMYTGPDPRKVAHYGREEAHPVHHEDHHLQRTVRSGQASTTSSRAAARRRQSDTADHSARLEEPGVQPKGGRPLRGMQDAHATADWAGRWTDVV